MAVIGQVYFIHDKLANTLIGTFDSYIEAVDWWNESDRVGLWEIIPWRINVNVND